MLPEIYEPQWAWDCNQTGPALDRSHLRCLGGGTWCGREHCSKLRHSLPHLASAGVQLHATAVPHLGGHGIMVFPSVPGPPQLGHGGNSCPELVRPNCIPVPHCGLRNLRKHVLPCRVTLLHPPLHCLCSTAPQCITYAPFPSQCVTCVSCPPPP